MKRLPPLVNASYLRWEVNSFILSLHWISEEGNVFIPQAHKTFALVIEKGGRRVSAWNAGHQYRHVNLLLFWASQALQCAIHIPRGHALPKYPFFNDDGFLAWIFSFIDFSLPLTDPPISSINELDFAKQWENHPNPLTLDI